MQHDILKIALQITGETSQRNEISLKELRRKIDSTSQVNSIQLIELQIRTQKLISDQGEEFIEITYR